MAEEIAVKNGRILLKSNKHFVDGRTDVHMYVCTDRQTDT